MNKIIDFYYYNFFLCGCVCVNNWIDFRFLLMDPAVVCNRFIPVNTCRSGSSIWSWQEDFNDWASMSSGSLLYLVCFQMIFASWWICVFTSSSSSFGWSVTSWHHVRPLFSRVPQPWSFQESVLLYCTRPPIIPICLYHTLPGQKNNLSTR